MASSVALSLTLLLTLLLALSAHTAYAGTSIANSAASDGMAKPSFTLPTLLKAQYIGVGKYGKVPLSGTGTLLWKTTAVGTGFQYEASLEIGALFYSSKVQSQGSVNAQGIHPLRTEEKNTGKTATVITINPAQQHVAVSGRSGGITNMPFDASGQDLLTVIAQLGTALQHQPKWRVAGEAKTFSVYRPSGLKQWRFQSQGMHTVTVGGVAVPTVHVVQVPVDASAELDEAHHFWLDPARHGFPVKLKKIKNASEFVELTLKDWQEQ